MDIQIKTSTLTEVLKLIVFANPSRSFPSAPIISFINDDYTIISNVYAVQLRMLEKSSIDWEYEKHD